uniref:FBD domain-containing protein n=1 Tax=Steinernema glaseri TaxID=37863 RepID=A0A1I8AQV6_9BILA
MDDVPYSFCEAVCATLCRRRIPSLGELSGYYGDIAWSTYPNLADYIVSLTRTNVRQKVASVFVWKTALKDGVKKRGHLFNVFSHRKLRTPLPKKFVRDVVIQLRDGTEEDVSRTVVNRFPLSFHSFELHSSSINKAWVDFACSLKRQCCIAIMKKLDDDSIPLFKTIVDAKKLSWLSICEEACDGSMLEILKTLIYQDHFEHLKIWNNYCPWKSAVVRDLLQFCSENSEKIRGTRLIVEKNCEGGVQQLEEFVLQRAAIKGRNVQTIQDVLKVCSKEECDFLDKYYRHHNYSFTTPSCVYKFEEGEGEERRRLYISFDCRNRTRTTGRQYASREGIDDLSLMRGTRELHVLFA